MLWNTDNTYKPSVKKARKEDTSECEQPPPSHSPHSLKLREF